MAKENSSFAYTYSAKQHDEISSILQKYTPLEENKMEQLRRLDQSVTRKGCVISLLLGTFSALILGFGMCCSMLWTGYFVLGIVTGITGLTGIVLTYPVYNLVTKKERKRIAPQIIALSHELMR